MDDAKASEPTAGIPKGSPLIDEKAASRSTGPATEGDHARPETAPNAGDPVGLETPTDAAGSFAPSDFSTRAEAAGLGGLADADPEVDVAGSEQVPGTFGDAVLAGTAAPETPLADPTELTNSRPEMPAGVDASPSSGKTQGLSGLAAEADSRQGDSMAGVAGISEDSSADNTQTEDSSTNRDYLSGNSDGAEQTYDVDNMSDAEVTKAAAAEADHEMGAGPGRAYLSGNSGGAEKTYDVDNMTNKEVMDAVNLEADYEFKGGSASTPAYVDSDSAGAGDAQVASDGARLGVGGFNINNPSTPGNIDPSEFGSGAEEARDTSAADLTNPGSADAADSFGAGAAASPPPSAGVDYGPDHVDTNPGAGPYDDPGGIGIGHDDGTIDFGFSLTDGDSAFEFAETTIPDLGSIADEVADTLVDDSVVIDFGD